MGGGAVNYFGREHDLGVSRVSIRNEQSLSFGMLNKMMDCVISYRQGTNNSPVNELELQRWLPCAIPPMKDMPENLQVH